MWSRSAMSFGIELQNLHVDHSCRALCRDVHKWVSPVAQQGRLPLSGDFSQVSRAAKVAWRRDTWAIGRPAEPCPIRKFSFLFWPRAHPLLSLFSPVYAVILGKRWDDGTCRGSSEPRRERPCARWLPGGNVRRFGREPKNEHAVRLCVS